MQRLRSLFKLLRYAWQQPSSRVREVLYHGDSDFQEIEILKLGSYGKCLVLDGIHQSSEIGEYIYHEAIVHPALFFHPAPRSVLIIGGGEGATLRETLKHPSVERAVMVDIDQQVVEVCREYLGWEDGAYDDPRTEVVIDDGTKYLRETDQFFDVIIVDSTTPLPGSIAQDLYDDVFFQVALSRLNDFGILAGFVASGGPSYFKHHLAFRRQLVACFDQVATYIMLEPFYPQNFSFALAVKGGPVNIFAPDRFSERLQAIQTQLRFYDEITHQRMFLLPKYLRTLIQEDAAAARD